MQTGTPPAGWSWTRSLSLLFASIVISDGLLAAWRGVETFGALGDAAAEYDTMWDPVVIDAGVLRVEGPRVPVSEDGKLIVDPTDAIDLDALDGDRTVVFRSQEAVQVRAFDRRVYRYRDLLEQLDLTTLRIDSTNLAAFNQSWGLLVSGSIFGLLLLFMPPIHLFGCVLLAGIATAPIALFWRPPNGPLAMATLRTALGVSALIPPVWVILSLAGHASSCCVDVCLFPPLVAAGTFLALRFR